MSLRLGSKQFETLVGRAVESLPEEFKRRLDNVLIAVEEEPTDDDYDVSGTPDDEELLGIFRGAMRTERSFDDLPGLPPEVIVFRGPILRVSETRAEALDEIRETVLHELGHLFGLEDEEMPY
ncbi:MAG TPA: metallopeptidase family protein [Thermoanaerobaculia bacterium]|nr:metallopeptidase family protein [Thermoanaerobaculia bacterium]